MRKRSSIVTKLMAKMLCKAGFTHIITMDLHQKEIQGFFDCPIDNLRASPFLLKYIQDSVKPLSAYYYMSAIRLRITRIKQKGFTIICRFLTTKTPSLWQEI